MISSKVLIFEIRSFRGRNLAFLLLLSLLATVSSVVLEALECTGCTCEFLHDSPFLSEFEKVFVEGDFGEQFWICLRD